MSHNVAKKVGKPSEPELTLYVVISPQDRSREKLLALSCKLGKDYASEKSLFVWILDSDAAAKQYKPGGEKNDKATEDSFVGLYSIVRDSGEGIQALSWRPEPDNRDRLVEIVLGPAPRKPAPSPVPRQNSGRL